MLHSRAQNECVGGQEMSSSLEYLVEGNERWSDESVRSGMTTIRYILLPARGHEGGMLIL